MGDEIVFNVANGQVTEMPATTLKGIGFRERADLQDADLEGADLKVADLRGTNLNGTNLSRANLQGARVTQEQLEAAYSLEGATMPNGQKYEDWLKDKE
jgi:uncharacterized protein YjbI with pentapeptide repeats